MSGKRVLVVGAGSYIGESFRRYAQGRLHVDVVDSYEEWKAAPFHEYDSVMLAAGLAHRKWTHKQHQANKDMYFAINRDLAVAVAEKAKAGGVEQFVYLSSMAVYGLVEGVITHDTKISPREDDYYGQSKFQAEVALSAMLGDALCIVRPPMVYGPGCPGKFAGLVKVAKMLPFVPQVSNRRSMIFVDNLCEFLCLVVEKRVCVALNPHNREHVSTSWLLGAVKKALGKQVWILPGLGLVVRMLKPFCRPVKTAFGSLNYHESAAAMPFDEDYQLVSLEESISRTISF